MGSDLYWLGKDIVERSHPRLVTLLKKIRAILAHESIDLDEAELIDEIDRELKNASIQ